jgi:hypothetical protein
MYPTCSGMLDENSSFRKDPNLDQGMIDINFLHLKLRTLSTFHVIDLLRRSYLGRFIGLSNANINFTSIHSSNVHMGQREPTAQVHCLPVT